MEKDLLYIKTSPLLRAIRIAAVVFMILSILCMYLSADDFRGQRQKDKDMKEELYQTPLSEDLFLLADTILANPNSVCRYSDIIEINIARNTKGRVVAEIRYVIAGEDGVACFNKPYGDDEFTIYLDDYSYDSFIHSTSNTIKYNFNLTDRGVEILFEEAQSR